MIEALGPFSATILGALSSVRVSWVLPAKLCRSPMMCPISCMTVARTNSCAYFISSGLTPGGAVSCSARSPNQASVIACSAMSQANGLLLVGSCWAGRLNHHVGSTTRARSNSLNLVMFESTVTQALRISPVIGLVRNSATA